MKSTTIAAAILASVAVAQPHGHNRHHHDKRELVTEWETVWETATVIIDDDSTQTIPPSPQETSSDTPIQFFETPSTTSSSAVETPKVETPKVEPSTPTTIISIAQSTYQAPSPPAPTSTYEAAPSQQTTETPAAPSTSTYVAAPPATSSSSGGSSGGSTGSDGIPYGEKFDGEITYYNAALGACGYEDVGKDDSENIVAIPKQFWDNISTATSYGINQPAHPLCDKTITITTSDGKTTKAKIRDRCDGCVNLAIDVTPHTFLDLFDSLDGGRLECSWTIDE
ncbi:putative allergen asp f7 protein [Daldinia childiae]|uniref:putative allergen asp f7 protein n=1 Tax=Daldinia childiae TaxID=326645 RepID=UPI00144564D7|nr:putative allergen asp f7 protein [Daldinia childiae]KAF3058434.1 putative allergen asp f7 protein [Daldinia childiae]